VLRTIGVENYRTFDKPFELELAALTILLGANSSGKSSIARLPPLVAQSLTERSAAPILWVSENIDFGSFADNVHNHDTSKWIAFSFGGEFRGRSGTLFSSRIVPIRWPSGPFKYKISIGSDGEDTELRQIQISVCGEIIQFNVSYAGWVSDIEFRGVKYKELIKGHRILFREGLFPTFWLLTGTDTYQVVATDTLLPAAAKILLGYAHANTTETAVTSLFSYLDMADVDSTMANIKLKSSRISSLSRKFDTIKRADKDRLWLLLFVSGLPDLIRLFESTVSGDITSGGYLAPVRAAALRYYRRRELSVDQIDSSGENLAIYLNSLRDDELDEINDDLETFFDHRIRVQKSEGHISLRISSGDEYEDNLADVGFGFSQLLPVIAQIHAASRSLNRTKGGPRLRNVSPIISVEQPELHLHPALQARLGNYFVHAVTKRRSDTAFRFLVETHSEPLVNEVASLVARGEINPSDVKIYLFERGDRTHVTKVTQAHVQSDGTIPDWPFGFFSSGKVRSILD